MTMKIEPHEITVRDLTKDYEDESEEGVTGYGGKLDIRPQYQREFVYDDEQREAVINTVVNNFPLNVMYWSVRKDGNYEIIDGQQRTISICQYIANDFSYQNKYFNNLQDDEQKKIYDYKLMIYFCSGTNSERLQWFKTINIAGEELEDQEILNAVYSGSWVSDARRHFSKSNCPASMIGKDYLKGSPIRQKYLETAIKWISKDKIEKHMSEHQHDQNANELWTYFSAVITWVEATFKVKRSIMNGVDWGYFYNKYHNEKFDTDAIEEKTKKLLVDDDVTKQSGIYPYILTNDEKYLSIRAFSNNIKLKVYEKQNGLCKKCTNKFELSGMEADHITPWHEGGKTIQENCQMLCKECNRRKSGK